MGSSQSVQVPENSDEEEQEQEQEQDEEDDDEEDEGEEEEEETEDHNGEPVGMREVDNHLVKKVLQQEPEMLPCYASASPLSPQLSSLGTPRLGPSIKVWDPYNVLAPPPPLPPPPVFSRSFSSNAMDEDRVMFEVFLISHGECQLSLRPDLVGGRCPEAALTANGKRQARALAVFLNSQGIRFNAVYSSPLDRARSMAVSACQEMNFAEEQIQTSDALVEMSQGHWEGCLRSEIYSAEMLSFIDNVQPDFCPPSGESLRQVEFRMVSFLNGTVLGLPEKLRSDFSSLHPMENQGFPLHNPHTLSNSIHDREGSSLAAPHWDMLQRQQQRQGTGLLRKKSGKSRLQFMTTTGDHEVEEEISPQESNHRSSLHDLSGRSSSYAPTCIGIFSHAVPIRCLLTGILGCSPLMSHKMCIDDSSVTVLQHSWKTGWQIKKLNDTAHLRLL